MNSLLFAFILSLAADSGRQQIALGHFTDCVQKGLPCGWEKYKETKGIALLHDSTGYYVNIQSSQDVESIGRRLKFNATEYPLLQWRWKALVFPDSGREDLKKKNDCAAGIYVVFKGLYPFNRIIKYVWSATLPVGTMLKSPYNGRTMIFVLRSGPASVNEWTCEKRNIRSDYLKAFGSPPPPVEGIAIQSDSDNTKTCASADYADIIVSRD